MNTQIIYCSIIQKVVAQRGITRKWTDKNGVIADISCVSCFYTSNTLILLSAITASPIGRRMAMTVGCLSAWYVDQCGSIFQMLIFTVCCTVNVSQQVQGS